MILLLAGSVSLALGQLALTYPAQAIREAAREEKPADRPERIAELIAKLASKEFRERDAATKTLDAIGQPALGALRKAAAGSDDIELRKRAEDLVHTIEDRRAAVRQFRGHEKGICQIRFSPDGSHFLSCCYDGTIKLWETKTGKEIRQFHGKQRVFIADKRGKEMREFKTAPESRTPEYHVVYAIAFASKGELAVSGGGAGHLCLWDLRTGKPLRHFAEDERLRTMALAVSPNGRWLLSAGTNEKEQSELHLWDLETAKEVRHLGHFNSPIYALAFLSDDAAFSAGKDAIIRSWDLKNGKETGRLEGHQAAVTEVSVSPDRCWILSSSWDTAIRLWDAMTGREVRQFTGHSDMVRSVKFTSDGGRALSASHDRTVRLWDVGTGRELRRFEGYEREVADVDISSDGRSVLSGSEDGMLRLWQSFD